jgi:Nif-specific regulatory protein
MKQAANSKPRLLALNGDAKPELIFLKLGEGESFTFGRNAACDLPVKDIAVSRQHCRIIRQSETYNLEDLGSHNGTFLNNLPIKTRRLEHGDQIRIGNFYFMFLIDENDDVPFAGAEFDDGALVTNSTIRLFPNAESNELPNDLNVLIKLGKAINEIKETEDLQVKILGIILEFIPARRGAILLTDDDFSAAQAINVSAKNYSDRAPMQISRTISEQVLREQVALLSNDLSDKSLKKTDSLVASQVTSLLCVPLLLGSRSGLIYLDSSDPDVRFTEGHLEQMTAVSFLVSAALENVESINNLRRENAILKNNLHIETNMVGESPPLKEVFCLVARVAPSDSTVLVTGESGTGKELVAQAIHRNSPRQSAPFVAINCAALNENLLESELFGHEKGAFTGALLQKKGKLEIADGGTVFLDEIGELAPAIQVKLLRVLQERGFERVGGTKPIKVNVRVIAATNRNLEDEVKNGKFRSDLFFRLNVVQIKIPPLRHRKSDILLLAQHFVQKYSERCHRKVVGLSREAGKILLEAEWQGNVRELENVIERAVVLGTTDKILPEDLPNEMVERATPNADFNGDFYEQVKQAKQTIVLSAVQNSGGNFTEAARLLGIHPNNLHRVIRELGIKEKLKIQK